MITIKHNELESAYSYIRHIAQRCKTAVTSPHQFIRYHYMRHHDSSISLMAQRSCIFVHIPKCAGNSIEKSLFGKSLGRHLSIWHYQMIFGPSEFRSFFKFTVVRNPWDRLVSAFFFLKEGGLNKHDKTWAEKNLSNYSCFEDFVKKWVSEKNIKSWIHFKNQTSFIFSGNSISVDCIIRMEELEKDFPNLCAILGVQRSSIRKENIRSNRRKDYRFYYNDATREIVEKVYKDDIVNFGYDFDNTSFSQ